MHGGVGREMSALWVHLVQARSTVASVTVRTMSVIPSIYFDPFLFFTAFSFLLDVEMLRVVNSTATENSN